MPVEITMPKLSDTMEEGTILRWFKQAGDRVEVELAPRDPTRGRITRKL